MADAQPTEDHQLAIVTVFYRDRTEPLQVSVPLGKTLPDGEVFSYSNLIEALDAAMEEGEDSFIQLEHMPPPDSGAPLSLAFLRMKNIELVSVEPRTLLPNA